MRKPLLLALELAAAFALLVIDTLSPRAPEPMSDEAIRAGEMWRRTVGR